MIKYCRFLFPVFFQCYVMMVWKYLSSINCFFSLKIIKNENHFCLSFVLGGAHSVHCGINLPQNHHPLSFVKARLKSANCPSPLLLGNPPL